MNMLWNKKVNIVRPVTTADGYGSTTVREQIIHFELNCRMVPIRGNELRIFGRKGQSNEHYLLAPIVDITENDFVVDGSTRYEIIELFNWQGKFLKMRIGLVK